MKVQTNKTKISDLIVGGRKHDNALELPDLVDSTEHQSKVEEQSGTRHKVKNPLLLSDLVGKDAFQRDNDGNDSGGGGI